jgi:hypothetical protein
MTDAESRATAVPRRVGGSSLAFVSAHGIKGHTDLSFEDAFALAKLVLEEGGGPVSCRGRGAVIKKPTETALMRRGLIEVHGSSEFTQRIYVQLIIDGRITDLLDVKFATARAIPKSVTERSRWAAVASQAAFDLVATYLPEST